MNLGEIYGQVIGDPFSSAVEVLTDRAVEEWLPTGEFLGLLRVLTPDEEKFFEKWSREGE